MYEFYKKLPGSPICVLGCFGRAWDTHQATASLLLEAKAQKQALSLSLSLTGLNRILPLSLSPLYNSRPKTLAPRSFL